MTSSEATRPCELDLDRTAGLRILWSDGLEAAIALPVLRRNCPCATCRDEREKRAKNPLHVMPAVANPADAVTVDSAQLVGNYALRIRWRDGHDTGIYDFGLLRSLCAGAGQTVGVTDR